MIEVGRAEVVDFLEWLQKGRPHLRSLRNLDESELMSLAAEYEASKGNLLNPAGMYEKWGEICRCFRAASDTREALEIYPH